jgi:two-component sensor histidine kinase
MLELNNSLLREAHHRSSNDLQLVVSMLQLSANSADEPMTRQKLLDVANRVRILAHARAALIKGEQQELAVVLREVCEALQAMAEPQDIVVALSLNGETARLPEAANTAAGLAVNELVTNALKHAFREGRSGQVSVALDGSIKGWIIIKVDDDGLPFPELAEERHGGRRKGMGLDLTRRLLAAQSGMLVIPPPGSKCFEIRFPAPAPDGFH